MEEVAEKEGKTFSNIKTLEDFATFCDVGVREYLFTPGEKTPELPASTVLSESLIRAQRLGFRSEHSIREAFIFPVLAEIFWLYQNQITLFSNEELKSGVEGMPGGICDYLIGGTPGQYKPTAPLISVVEAKREDFETGTWQCAAELYVCKLTNERAGRPYPIYIGVVTIGRMWLFIKLDVENNLLIRDTYYYSIDNLPRLLGVWKWALDSLLGAAPAA